MPKTNLVKIDLEGVKATLIASVPHDVDRQRILKGIGAAAMHYWKKLAQQQLKSTSRDYIAGIELKETPGGGVTVELNGQLANMVEQGFSGGDMRAWMLSSPKAKQGKNGPYLVVPFRHGTPGTSGRNVGAAMPGPIHTAAKKLLGTLSRPGKPVSTTGGQTTIYGKRLHPGLTMRQAARQILKRKEKPWHATGIYMGMIRKEKLVKGGPQTSGYQTFRTISAKVRVDPNDPNSPMKHWVHPGIKPRNIARQVQKHIEKLATHIVRQATQ
jgi:hypothetical protein